MKENPIIVPVALSDSDLKSHSGSATSKDKPVCHFKIKDAEVTFYNGVNKYILLNHLMSTFFHSIKNVS